MKAIIEKMSERLSSGDRVEIRGFGSFASIIALRECVEIQKLEKKYLCEGNTFPILNLVKSFGRGLTLTPLLIARIGANRVRLGA